MTYSPKFHRVLFLSLGVFFCAPLLSCAQKPPKLSLAQQKQADAQFIALWKTRDDTPDNAPQFTRSAVQKALDTGANVNARDSHGQTALIAGLEFFRPHDSRIDIVRLLLAHGADVNAKSEDGATALMFANSPAVAQLLLSHGAEVNVKTHISPTNGMQGTNGMTPLMWASNPKVVKLLLDHGADVNAKDADGDTALSIAKGRLSIAKVRDNADVVKLLKAAGAK